VGRTYHAEQRQIVGFRAATYQHDFVRIASQYAGQIKAGLFELLLGRLAVIVDTGSVPVRLAKTRDHRIQHLARHGCRRVMVKVEAIHGKLLSS
jgi:hypothetical protein